MYLEDVFIECADGGCGEGEGGGGGGGEEEEENYSARSRGEIPEDCVNLETQGRSKDAFDDSIDHDK